MSCDDAQPAALLPAFDGTPLRAAVSVTADAPGFERLESLQRFDAAAALGTGAAPVTDAVKAWIIEHFGACLAEGYGLNETFVVTTTPPELQRAKPGSSGRPYRHVKIEIRDPEGKVLPAGETGEIRVWTPLNVSGYVNAAPLGPDTLDARGFFRTGDVGRLDADGVLYVSDRLKDMLIFGGANVYPAEVERVLGLHPAVMDAPVIGVPDDEMGERVLAFRELKPRLSANCVSRSARTGFARSEIASGLRVELTHPSRTGRDDAPATASAARPCSGDFVRAS